MTVDGLMDAFRRYSTEYRRFERVASPRSTRPDLAAFLMLDEAVPGAKEKMVSSAEHDEVWLSVDVTRLAAVATDALVCDLVRCGVRYDAQHRCLMMLA